VELTAQQARGLLEHHQVAPPVGLEAVAITVSRTDGIVAALGAASIVVDPLEGLPEAEANRLAAAAGLPGSARGAAATALTDLWRLVLAEDLLAVRHGPDVAAITLDDAAAFRHPDWSRFGFEVDPAGGPYLAKTDAIAAIDAGSPLPPEDWARLPAMDQLIVRAYAQAR
jgi:hypothetical protein